MFDPITHRLRLALAAAVLIASSGRGLDGGPPGPAGGCAEAADESARVARPKAASVREIVVMAGLTDSR